MEDPEESAAIKICTVPFKIREKQLVFRELMQLCTIVISILFIIGTCMIYSRTPVLYNTIDIRWFSIVACLSSAAHYLFSYLNLLTLGWGSSDGRFWCDIKIMIVRGFNTIRTISRCISSPMLYVQFAYLLGVWCPTTLLFLCMLIILSELQLGWSENINQYDVQTHDKFVSSDNLLLLESVHKYQTEYPQNKVSYMPFVVYCQINIVTCTILLVQREEVATGVTFAVPLIVMLVLYNVCLPIFAHLAYLKSVWTYCEYEIYRSLLDTVFLTLLTLFIFV
jgi:hypothetical protein